MASLVWRMFKKSIETDIPYIPVSKPQFVGPFFGLKIDVWLIDG